MKVGLLADIHANHDALAAVLEAARGESVEQLLVAGDLVGYYYEPRRTLELLDRFAWTAVKGNHERMLEDWLAGRRRDEIRSNYGSGISVAAKELSAEACAAMSALPENRSLQIDGRSVHLCHGSPWDPDHYVYPDTTAETKRRFFDSAPLAGLVVFGHTHHPCVWEDGRRVVVNPGSVGQPRDRRPGACWALWDTAEDKITLRREQYDLSRVLRLCADHDPGYAYLSEVLQRT